MTATAPVRDLFAGMNKTETKRGVELEALRRDGQIVAWWYEGWTFKLADDTRYTPDFVVQYPDGRLEAEEIKGHWRDDALVKCRVFVELFPIPLRVLLLRRGDWEVVTWT